MSVFRLARPVVLAAALCAAASTLPAAAHAQPGDSPDTQAAMAARALAANEVVSLPEGVRNPFAPTSRPTPSADGSIDISVLVVPVVWPGGTFTAGQWASTSFALSAALDTWSESTPATFTITDAEPITRPQSPCTPSPSVVTSGEFLDDAHAQVAGATADIVIFTWPKADPACGGWRSLATQARSFSDAGGLAWFNGLSGTGQDDSDWAHALGHVLGFADEDRLVCRSRSGRAVSDATSMKACQTVAGGHAVSVMGDTWHRGYASLANILSAGAPATIENINPKRTTSIQLKPRFQGAHGAVLRANGRTYTVEYRYPELADRDLGFATDMQPGVYVTFTIDDDPLPRRTYTLDGDTSTPEARDRYRWNLPLFKPLRLATGGSLTVVKVGKTATVVYTPDGGDVPMPPKPKVSGIVSGLGAVTWGASRDTFACVAQQAREGKWVNKRTSFDVVNFGCSTTYYPSDSTRPPLRIGVRNSTGTTWVRVY